MSQQVQTLQDDSLMLTGQFKGQKMANIPAKYLLWFRDNMRPGPFNDLVFEYIDDNMDVLIKESQEGVDVFS